MVQTELCDGRTGSINTINSRFIQSNCGGTLDLNGSNNWLDGGNIPNANIVNAGMDNIYNGAQHQGSSKMVVTTPQTQTLNRGQQAFGTWTTDFLRNGTDPYFSDHDLMIWPQDLTDIYGYNFKVVPDIDSIVSGNYAVIPAGGYDLTYFNNMYMLGRTATTNCGTGSYCNQIYAGGPTPNIPAGPVQVQFSAKCPVITTFTFSGTYQWPKPLPGDEIGHSNATIFDRNKFAPFKAGGEPFLEPRTGDPRHDEPRDFCMPAGFPGGILSGNAMQFVPDERLSGDGARIPAHDAHYSARRTSASTGIEPTYYGDPVGHWEGDTLIIETTNFKRWALDDYFYTNPKEYRMHSDALRIIERIRWKNPKMLSYELTDRRSEDFHRALVPGVRRSSRNPDWAARASSNTSAKKTTAAPAGSARRNNYTNYTEDFQTLVSGPGGAGSFLSTTIVNFAAIAASAPATASTGAITVPMAATLTGISTKVLPFSSLMTMRRTLPSWIIPNLVGQVMPHYLDLFDNLFCGFHFRLLTTL